MAHHMNGKHGPESDRVTFAPIKETHVDQLDKGKEYLLRPCAVDSGQPEPHCIAATGGELIDGSDRRALTADGLAELGYGPVLHSGRVLCSVPTKASLKAGRKRKFEGR